MTSSQRMIEADILLATSANSYWDSCVRSAAQSMLVFRLRANRIAALSAGESQLSRGCGDDSCRMKLVVLIQGVSDDYQRLGPGCNCHLLDSVAQVGRSGQLRILSQLRQTRPKSKQAFPRFAAPWQWWIAVLCLQLSCFLL